METEMNCCETVREKNIQDYCVEIGSLMHNDDLKVEEIFDKIFDKLDDISNYDIHRREWFESRLKEQQEDIENLHKGLNSYRTVLKDMLQNVTRWD